MKRVLLFTTLGLLLALVLILASPFLLLQFGSPGMAMASRALLHAAIGYSDAEPIGENSQLRAASGYRVDVFAQGLGNIRMVVLTGAGDLLVSRPRGGEVLRLSADRNGDGLADGSQVILSGLSRPHGLALHKGWLYVAESNAVGRVEVDERGALRGDYQRIVEGLADGGNHWTKSIGFGPDGWLYLSSGSSCNVCEEGDPQRATIMRMRGDGSELSVFASGLRNSVGFDWAPWNGELYATDNGRDMLGDDFPPCELNRVVEGGFYGWPYYNAERLDPDYGELLPEGHPQNRPPVHGFAAHNAPLGIHFLRHQGQPSQRTALVALHGSWNRSQPDGYKVVSLNWRPDGSIDEVDFVSGFLQGDILLGRPVDVVESAAGEVFITDDYSGRVYRVHRGPALPAASAPAVELQTTRDTGLENYSEAEREARVAQGAQLYRQYRCENCHSEQMRPLVGLAERYSVAGLSNFFTSPTPPMPNFGLSDVEREALAVYLLLQP